MFLLLSMRLHEQGLCDRCWCPFIYIYIHICDPQKSLNGTLAVDSHFQILVVDFSYNSWSTIFIKGAGTPPTQPSHAKPIKVAGNSHQKTLDWITHHKGIYQGSLITTARPTTLIYLGRTSSCVLRGLLPPSHNQC